MLSSDSPNILRMKKSTLPILRQHSVESLNGVTLYLDKVTKIRIYPFDHIYLIKFIIP